MGVLSCHFLIKVASPFDGFYDPKRLPAKEKISFVPAGKMPCKSFDAIRVLQNAVFLPPLAELSMIMNNFHESSISRETH